MENKNQKGETLQTAESIGTTEMQNKLNVISNRIYGDSKKDNIYMILWERIANNGLIYCYANTEEEAYNEYGFKLNKNVRHTIIKLDRENMPVTDGRDKK